MQIFTEIQEVTFKRYITEPSCEPRVKLLHKSSPLYSHVMWALKRKDKYLKSCKSFNDGTSYYDVKNCVDIIPTKTQDKMLLILYCAYLQQILSKRNFVEFRTLKTMDVEWLFKQEFDINKNNELSRLLIDFKEALYPLVDTHFSPATWYMGSDANLTDKNFCYGYVRIPDLCFIALSYNRLLISYRMASNLDFKKYQDFRLTNINVKNTSLIRKVLEEYYSSDSDTKRKLVVTDYFNNGIWDLSVHNYFAEKQGTLYRKFADTQKEEHIIECSGEHEIDDINTGPPECIVSLNESLPSITNFFYWKIEDEMNAIRRLFRISPADNLIDRLYEIYESLKYNIEFNVKDREVNVKESGVSSRVRDEYTPNYTRTEHAEVLMLKRYLFSRKGHVLAKLWDSTRPDIANDKRAFNIHTIFNVYSKIKSSKIRDINKLMERYADEKVRHERNYA